MDGWMDGSISSWLTETDVVTMDGWMDGWKHIFVAD